MEISFTHIPPPDGRASAKHFYNKGWQFAEDALRRYGAETCNNMRKRIDQSSAYNRGAADRFDGKPHKYGKDST